MAKKPGPKKGYTYGADRQVDCPLCLEGGTTRTFRSKPGLSGHLQFFHSLDRESVSEVMANLGELAGGKPVADLGLTTAPETEKVATTTSPTSPVAPSNRERRAQVEAKKLEAEDLEADAKIEALRARQASRTKIPDVGEQLGLGALTPETRAQLQGKTFDTQPQEQQPKWYEKILGNMSVGEALGLARNALGVGQGGGDLQAIGGLLQLLGARNLKDLMGNSQAPVAVAPEAFDLPDGTRLPAGFPLDANLISTIIKAKSGDPMQSTAEHWLKVLSPLIAEKAEDMKAVREGRISGKPAQPKQAFMTCPGCGTKFDVSTATPGDTMICPRCEAELVYEDTKKPSSKGQPKREGLKPFIAQEPELPTIQCECGQLLSYDPQTQGLGSVLVCGICGKENTLMSATEAMPAMEPTPKGPEFEERRRR